MIQIDMFKNFDLRKISLDLSDIINKAIKLVGRDIRLGIERGVVAGSVFAPNAPSTLKIKASKGQGAKPLEATGLLKDDKRMQRTKATKANQVATLLPNSERVDISFWNDQGTKTIPARKHWGISDDAENKIITLARNTIKKNIKKARRAKRKVA